MSAHGSKHGVVQEPDALSRRGILLALAGSLLAMALGVVWAGAMVHARQGSLAAHGAQPHRAPREIGIVDQTPIEGDHYGLRLRAYQRAKLEHYGWADRANGVATIPIDRAMDMVAAGADAGVGATP